MINFEADQYGVKTVIELKGDTNTTTEVFEAFVDFMIAVGHAKENL